MERLLISACLIGADCKYSGGNNALDGGTLRALRGRYELVPVCPEFAGGLPTPRDPSERLNGRVVSCNGRDVTREYERGADVAFELARRFACHKALMKERSPSCGSGQIYDGSFSGTLTDGWGTAAALLRERGVCVVGESRLEELLRELDIAE